MIEPVLADDRLLEDIAAASDQEDEFNLWWLGQSGFLVKWVDRHLLLDPYLSDSLTRKYADSDKPHIRMTRRAIDPGRLSFIDVVTSSHNHTDHLDRDTLVPLLRASPDATLVIPEANRTFVAERLAMPREQPVGVDDGVTVSVRGVSITGVPAAHEEVERDEQGRLRFLGYVIRLGSRTIYHSGDTMWFDGLTERLRAFSLDLALLPINGRAPERRVAGNLDGPEAARLASEIGARMVIPCHYEMFTFNTASPRLFLEEAERIGQPYRVLRCGERWSSREIPGRS